MSADNLAIWSVLCKTDPKHTKQFTRGGGFKGTATRPIYHVERMTELFGPCGVGWGCSEPTFQIVNGADGEVAVYSTLALWYVEPASGKKSEPIPGIGGDFIVKKIRDRLVTDDEAFKKAATDAMGNAMKEIGMSADIHMGRFDDSKYVSELRREFDDSPEPSQPARQQADDAPKRDKPNAAFEVMGSGPDDFATRVIALVKDAPDAATIQAIRDANAGGLTRLQKDNKALWDSVMQAMSNRTTDVMEKAA